MDVYIITIPSGGTQWNEYQVDAETLTVNPNGQIFLFDKPETEPDRKLLAAIPEGAFIRLKTGKEIINVADTVFFYKILTVLFFILFVASLIFSL